ncbi:MAG TPA: GNAT family N-acetyltransferase [Aggregatilineales bacterium]|nr:GNAT family N-acetyltransferase [Aggregatilineales bacterium]
MIEVKNNRRQQMADLFTGHNGDHMADAILDDYMGNAYMDAEKPTFGILELPVVRVVFLGGDLTHPSAYTYLENLPKFSRLFVASPNFEKLAQKAHPGKWVCLERYAFSSENLDITKLRELSTQLPDGFQVKKIDTALAKALLEDKENEFASYHGVTFDSPDDFVARGFGYCVCEGETIACVASTFTISNTGIEIQIDTKPDYRGKGLATVAAAHLMLHSLESNLDPSWDAATKISAKMAQKLGYTPQGTYEFYIFTGSRFLVYLRNIVQIIKKIFGIKVLLR